MSALTNRHSRCEANVDIVRKVIASCLGLSPQQLSVEMSLAEDLGADSLDMLALANELETHFNVVIADDAVWRIRRIRDAARCIQTARESSGAADLNGESEA